MERIWRREELKVPQKQRPRRRLWLNDGSCIRLRPERANHVTMQTLSLPLAQNIGPVTMVNSIKRMPN